MPWFFLLNSHAQFLSTSSARRTTGKADRCGCRRSISIHVLREEDDLHYSTKSAKSRISIHVLREEDDHRALAVRADLNAFLSTSSARRTTYIEEAVVVRNAHFYPRPPRGGRLQTAVWDPKHLTISIHVLREEDDPEIACTRDICCSFLSTSSARRTTDPAGKAVRRSGFLSTSSARRTTADR